MGKKYMDTKVGTLEESILGVWQDTVDDIEEKYTDAQRAAREKSRGSDGRVGSYGGQAAARGLKKTHKPGDKGDYGTAQARSGDAETGKISAFAYDKKTGSSNPRLQDLRRKHGSGPGGTGKSGRDMAGKKLDVLKRKRDVLKKEREKLAASYEPNVEVLDVLGEKILFLTDLIREGLENSPNPANSQHLCAKNVVHEEWGFGKTVPTMHDEPDAEGNIAWYDVMFEHGIEEGVLISELKVTKSEMHIHSSKKKKVDEDNTNDNSDDGEGMDKVQPKALKKKFKNRKDKDIDNDGDVDSSDEYIDNKRKAISKSMKERWTEAVLKVKENANEEDPSDEDDDDEKKSKGKKAKIEINPEIEVENKKK